MGPRGLLCLILLCSTANAGIVGFGNYAMATIDMDNVPEFEDMFHAANWAHEIKFNNKLYRMLKNKLKNYEITSLQNIKSDEKGSAKRAKKAIDQYEACALAIAIMRDYRGKGNNAMTSEEYYKDYKIPWFDNRESAVIWAHKTKWVEPIRRLLKRRMAELMAEAQLTAGNLDPLMLKKTAYYMAEWEDCMVALKIINEYKKRGEVGSTFVASSVPVL